MKLWRWPLTWALTFALLVTGAAGAEAKNPPPPASLTEGVDAHLGYKPQRTCSPSAKPGTKALLSALIATWGGSSWGISRMCSVGGTSEHKEGRALDWHMDVRYASQRARVDDALRWITANNGEVAYRLGIMYVIWNQRIWSIYYPELGWRKMPSRGSYTANHKDHVHISLSWDGAMAQTSWWTGVTRAVPLLAACGTGAYPACLPRTPRAATTAWPTLTTPVPPTFLPYPGPVPNLGGSPQVGRTLTAVPGTWVPDGATLTYQWLRDGAVIPGAAGPTYVVQAADLAAEIKVRVTATAGDVVVTKTSDGTAEVYPGRFTTVAPIVTGDARTDGVLSVDPGVWSPAPTTFRYQWRRDGTAITGATYSTYAVRAGDVGHAITVTVKGSSPGFVTASRASAKLVPVKATFTTIPTPWITGTIATGSRLTAQPGTWVPGASFSYRWYRDGVSITGATYRTYVLTRYDKGRTITVRVKASRSGYVTVYRMSVPAGELPPPDPATVTSGSAAAAGAPSSPPSDPATAPSGNPTATPGNATIAPSSDPTAPAIDATTTPTDPSTGAPTTSPSGTPSP